MKLFSFGLVLSIGWHLGDCLTDFLYNVFIGVIKRARWYQAIFYRQETVNNHDHANAVKNKIGFDIN